MNYLLVRIVVMHKSFQAGTSSYRGMTHQSITIGFGLRHVRVSHLVFGLHTLGYHQRWAFEQQTHILLQIYNRFTTDFLSVTDSNSVVILWVEILVNNRITTELKSVNWFTGFNYVVNLLFLKTYKWIEGWIPSNFKIFILSLNCHFWRKIRKMITGANLLYIWFSRFTWNGPFQISILIMAIFAKNF